MQVCCAIWSYIDCLQTPLTTLCADTVDYDLVHAQFTSNMTSNAYLVYCLGYEYGTHRCWPIHLWAWMVIGFALLLLTIVGGCVLAWYWNSGVHQHVTHYRSTERRRRQYLK